MATDHPILLVSDLHTSVGQMAWVEEHASEYEAVVIAGDLLDLGSPVERAAQETRALWFLERVRRRSHVVVCSGNHDLERRPHAQPIALERSASWLRRARRNGIVTDGGSLELGDTVLTALGLWDGPRTRALAARQLAAAARMVRGRRWVWVHHAPPRGTAVGWNGRRDCGDPVLRAWMEEHRPGLILAGHVHQAPFAPGGSWCARSGRSWILNAGQQIGPVPAHVALHMGSRTARWTSLAGHARADLDGLVAVRSAA